MGDICVFCVLLVDIFNGCSIDMDEADDSVESLLSIDALRLLLLLL